MGNSELQAEFADLSTPLIADACMRVGAPVRQAPAGIRPLLPSDRLAGRVRPVRHYGSVDIFLRAVWTAEPGDVLTIDNGGRMDEACIGDLIVLEAQAAGLGGIAIWGSYRDSSELLAIGLPVFAYGACASGPQRLDAMPSDALASASFGELAATRDDVVFADLDGALFVATAHVDEVLSAAHAILKKERAQAEAVRAGRTLREQLRFDEYWQKRTIDPEYTFRKHLRGLDGAIEV